jgi:chromosome segregation ATPase
MAKHEHLEKRELLNLVNLAASYLQAKKVRGLITSEIRWCSKEIAHLKDKAAAVEGQLRETQAAIEARESRVMASQKQLLEAQAEMRAAEKENARIEAFSGEVMLPGLRLKVSQLKAGVQQESPRLPAVQSSYQRAAAGGRISALVKEIAALTAQLEEEEGERESLLCREQELQLAVKELSSYTALDEARESLSREVKTLEEEQIHLERALEAKKQAWQELESDIRGLDHELKREKGQAQELSGNLAYLESRVQEFGRIKNLGGAMERLEKQVTGLDGDLAVNRAFFGIVGSIRDDTEAMNTALKMAVADYRQVFDKLEGAIRSL